MHSNLSNAREVVNPRRPLSHFAKHPFGQPCHTNTHHTHHHDHHHHHHHNHNVQFKVVKGDGKAPLSLKMDISRIEQCIKEDG
jgi:hypothetical protein